MIKLGEEIIVWWPGTVIKPADGGKTIEHEIELQCKVVSDISVRADLIFREIEAQIDFLFEHIKDWKGIGDKDGNQLPYNRESFNAAMRDQHVNEGITKAWASASKGAAVKN